MADSQTTRQLRSALEDAEKRDKLIAFALELLEPLSKEQRDVLQDVLYHVTGHRKSVDVDIPELLHRKHRML